MTTAEQDVSTNAPSIQHHLLSLLVENKAGVLVRIAGLFARRGFNIVSLAVAPTDNERFSRLSIVVDADSAPLQQVREQLNKLINVVEITEFDQGSAREAELLLATVSFASTTEEGLRKLGERAHATVIDENANALTFMLAGHPLELDRFAFELRAFGIRDLQRTGRVALAGLS